MFAYLALTVMAFFAVMFGVSQWLVAEFPWGLWVAPVCGLVAFVLWIAAQTGQGLAADEMVLIEQVIQDCMDK